MFTHKAGFALTGTLFIAVMGCQEAETPPLKTSGPIAEATEPVAAAEETTLVPEAPSTEIERFHAEEIVAAKITPPVVDPPSEAPAAEPEPLTIGDAAPPLNIATWVTGEPVGSFEPGQVYVVEFWATWCGPCKTSMPHLSQLNEEYGEDVQMIGVTRETAEIVEEFLDKDQSDEKTWRDVVTYRLAADADSTTNTAYMQAAGQSGIPTAFIVGRDGIIEWIGHPMSMDQSLASVVSGDYDRSAALAQFEQQQRLKQASRQLSLHVRAEEYDQALEVLATLEASVGESPGLLMTKLSILQRAGRHDEAAPLQTRLVEQVWDNAQALNQIAWNIATGQEPRDLEVALKAAAQACELTDHENASILDTLARVYYEMGNLDEAVTWQKQAVEHGSGNKQLQTVLETYQSEKSPGTSAETASEDSTGDPEESSEPESQDSSPADP